MEGVAQTDRGPTILVCDDEELIRWSLSQHLSQEGYHTVTARNGAEAVEAVKEWSPSLLLMDLKMPVMDGMEALQTLRQGGFEVPVLMITAYGSVDSAIRATQLGADGYLAKPFDLQEVSRQVEQALADGRIRNEVHLIRGGRTSPRYGDFVGQSPALARTLDIVQRLESVDAPTVLLLGESGTGKDVLARAIHTRGLRRKGELVEVDCAAMPEQLIESELFGHERGAFTDAHATKRGLFEVAAGGVVFLDEIGEMTHGTQAKLLRALESRTFKRVGGTVPIRMDAGLIAATNRDLRAEVTAGRFRQDLYFRLNVVPIHIPPLRERTDDIPLLTLDLLESLASVGHPVRGLTGEAMRQLQTHDWPGNVRELRNVLERIVILGVGSDGMIRAEHLPAEIRYARPSDPSTCPFVLPEEGVDLEAVERDLLIQAIERTNGNQSAAARLLGISRYALRYRIEKYELQ